MKEPAESVKGSATSVKGGGPAVSVNDVDAEAGQEGEAEEVEAPLKLAYPTMYEVLYGLKELLDDKIRLNTKKLKQRRLIDAIQLTYEEVYQEIIRCLAMPDLEQELNETPSDFNYSLCNPLSKAVFVILYFYSLEPPFYHVVNEACRTMNEARLPIVGPIAKCLGTIFKTAEDMKRDRVQRG